jgi:hypothetical protein
MSNPHLKEALFFNGDGSNGFRRNYRILHSSQFGARASAYKDPTSQLPKVWIEGRYSDKLLDIHHSLYKRIRIVLREENRAVESIDYFSILSLTGGDWP